MIGKTKNNYKTITITVTNCSFKGKQLFFYLEQQILETILVN
jgi:hypothetical protein